MLRLVDAYNLYLVELMQTVQTANVLAVRSSLTTEASRVSATLDRQIFLVENLVTEDVRYRHLCGWNKVEVVELALIHLSLLIRKLTGTVTRSLVHNVRRLYLKVATLASFIKEERLKSTLQASHLAYIDRETGTCNLNAQIKVDKIELFAKIPVAHSVLREIRHFTTFLNDNIVACVLAFRNIIVRDVRNSAKLSYEVFLCLCLCFFKLFVYFFKRRYFFLYFFSLFFVALFHKSTDLGCHLLCFCKVRVKFLLCLATTLVDCEHFVNGFLSTLEVLLVQTADNTFCFLTDEFKCKHI